jgi:oxygen-independent coproporphyrinogen-3 oxidase
MPKYQDALCAHIRESTPAISKYYVDSVYFGGGTPSYFGAKQLCAVFEELRNTGRVLKESEVTVEVNPDSAKFRELRMLRKEGFNRLSLGVSRQTMIF